MNEVTAPRRRRADSGAGGVEYAGIILIVSSLLAAAIAAPSADVIAPRVAYSICQAFDKLPGGGGGCEAPRHPESRAEEMLDDCVVRRTDRTDSVNVQVKVVRAENGSGDTVTENADGSASVQLRANSGVGVAAPTKGKKGSSDSGVGGEADLTAYAMAMGELEYGYNFPADQGGTERAEDFVDGRRGVGDRIVDTAMPGAQTVREGGTRLKDGVSNGIEDGFRWVTRNELSDEEKAERASEQHLSQADTVSAAFSVQGLVGVSGSAGYRDKDVVRGSADASGSLTGKVTTALTTEGDQAGDNKFKGELRYDLNGEVTVGLQGRDGNGDLTGLPPFLNGSGSFGQTWDYEVTYEDGEPVQVTFTGETRKALGAGIEPKVGPASAGGNLQDGTVSQEVRVLDLTDPANRSAFDDVFATAEVDVDGHGAGISVPKNVSTTQLPEFVRSASALWDRTEQDAVFYNFEYDSFGTGLGGEYENENSVGARVAGGGISSTDQTLTLTSATGRDARTGEANSELASCG
ncbi:hypothetical protein [Serinicoccus kebangsaanensis]|uniref:hypothetical protein n=1 Tax=Serinicoccus kebangsaanensis TaxID=2602069 RepID=UPI00124DB965|nr:hypothetical protein [Serinicoccus kebangsaanensis]